MFSLRLLNGYQMKFYVESVHHKLLEKSDLVCWSNVYPSLHEAPINLCHFSARNSSNKDWYIIRNIEFIIINTFISDSFNVLCISLKSHSEYMDILYVLLDICCNSVRCCNYLHC
jgi:hypothetical protein